MQQNMEQIRKSIVGKFLQKKREKAGKTQWEVAHAMDYTTPQFVSNWERGVSVPPLDALPKIAAFLNVSAREFQDTMIKYEEAILREQKKLIRSVLRGAK